LKEEVSKLSPDFSIAEVQSLPYLQYVIQETLRLYGAVSSGLQRRTPKGGCQVGEVFVPEGTTVTTQSFTLHRNPEIFEAPLRYSSHYTTSCTKLTKEIHPRTLGEPNLGDERSVYAIRYRSSR
jgi:azaphilone biosynthesis cytochrome P450 monooxygenase